MKEIKSHDRIPYSGLSLYTDPFQGVQRGLMYSTLFGSFDASIPFSRYAKVYLIQVYHRICPFQGETKGTNTSFLGLSTHPYPFQGVRIYTLFRSINESIPFQERDEGG